MGVYRDKETGLFRYDFRLRGRRWTGRGFATEVKARAAEYDLRRDLDRGHTDAFSTFAELADAWLEAGAATKDSEHLRAVKSRLNRVWSHLSHLPPKLITRGHIEPTLNRLARTYKPNTINAYRRDICAIFNYGISLGALAVNPVKGIPMAPDNGDRRQPIPTEALKALIAAAAPDLRARLIFASQTGCRWIELARLRWEDVVTDGPHPVALLATRKRRGGHLRYRPQPLTPVALEAIESMRGRHDTYVFAAPYRHGQASYSTDKLHLRLLCKRVGMGHYTWHQIRHWTGFTAARAGKNRRAIADLLGHQSVSATDRYIHAANEEVWHIAKALEEAIQPPSGGETPGDSKGSEKHQGVV